MESKRSLKSIIDRRKALFARKPEVARYKPHVTTEWKGGLLNENTIRDHTILSDYPAPSGGSDKSANPMEMALAALGSCISAVYVEYAAELDIKLDAVKVELEGSIDLRGLFNVVQDVVSGFEGITYEVTLETSEPHESVKTLIDLAENHCPVSDSLARPVNIQKNVTVVKPGSAG